MRRLASEAYFKRLVLDKIAPYFYYHNNVSCGNQLGVPDTFVEGRASSLWLEFKILKQLPSISNNLINIPQLVSTAQIKWFKRRLSLYKDVLLVIGFIVDNKIRVYYTNNLTKKVNKDYLLSKSLTLEDFTASVKERLM